MRPLWGVSPLVVARLCSPRVDGSSAGSESGSSTYSGSLVGAGVAKDAGAGVEGAERWIHRTSISCAQTVPRLDLADAAATPPRQVSVGWNGHNSAESTQTLAFRGAVAGRSLLFGSRLKGARRVIKISRAVQSGGDRAISSSPAGSTLRTRRRARPSRHRQRSGRAPSCTR